MTTFVKHTSADVPYDCCALSLYPACLGVMLIYLFFRNGLLYLSLKTRSDDGRGSFDYPSQVILFRSIEPPQTKNCETFPVRTSAINSM